VLDNREREREREDSMGLQCYFGGTTIQTLKLAAIPASSRFILKPISKTLVLNPFSRHNYVICPQRNPFKLLVRALSATAVQTAPITESLDNKGSIFLTSFCFSFSQEPSRKVILLILLII
jgi:hypothetical protein